MKVALTVNDFLDRAEQVYGDRVGIIDEPDQPAASWGSLTYRQVAAKARAQAASLDALGVGVGERVAAGETWDGVVRWDEDRVEGWHLVRAIRP